MTPGSIWFVQQMFAAVFTGSLNGNAGSEYFPKFVTNFKNFSLCRCQWRLIKYFKESRRNSMVTKVRWPIKTAQQVVANVDCIEICAKPRPLVKKDGKTRQVLSFVKANCEWRNFRFLCEGKLWGTALLSWIAEKQTLLKSERWVTLPTCFDVLQIASTQNSREIASKLAQKYFSMTSFASYVRFACY